VLVAQGDWLFEMVGLVVAVLLYVIIVFESTCVDEAVFAALRKFCLVLLITLVFQIGYSIYNA
jgi:uncharacterized integral membrane protein